MATTRFEESSDLELYMGFHIRKRDGIFIAAPEKWAHGQGETIVAADLQTLRKEIHRWWYQVGA